jgi:hypothetical protein
MPVRTSRMLIKRTNVQSTPVIHFRPHRWHGLEVGPEPPQILNAFIEITPFDLMKYEVEGLRVSACGSAPTFLCTAPDLVRLRPTHVL